MHDGILDRLGIDADGLALFLAACESGDDVRATCVEAGHDGPTTRRLIESLREAGLIAPVGDNGGPLLPVNPGRVLAPALGSLQREVTDGQALLLELKDLQDTLQEGFGRYEERTASQRLVEVIFGADAVNERLESLPVRGCRDRCLRPGPPLKARRFESDVDQLGQLLEERTIYDRQRMEDPEEAERVSALAELGQLVRISHVPLPMRSVLVDESYAVLPLTADDTGEAGAIIVHSSSIVGALGALFEEIWRRSSPLGSASRHDNGDVTPPVSSDDLALLDLMLLGLTDEALARRLGVSARTVRRRVSAMQDRLGVTTRYQLAAVATAMGWLRPADSVNPTTKTWG